MSHTQLLRQLAYIDKCASEITVLKTQLRNTTDKKRRRYLQTKITGLKHKLKATQASAAMLKNTLPIKGVIVSCDNLGNRVRWSK